MGGEQRRHPVLPSRQWKWQRWQLWVWQDPFWRGDKSILGEAGVDDEVEGVADCVVDGKDLAVGESVLVQRGIQS